MKRKFLSAEDDGAYHGILKQMLSEMLVARQERSVGAGNSHWRVPNLVTGMMERGREREDGGERMENKRESCGGEGENEEGRGKSMYKRRDKLYRFIKKTVVPYPRLG